MFTVGALAHLSSSFAIHNNSNAVQTSVGDIKKIGSELDSQWNELMKKSEARECQ